MTGLGALFLSLTPTLRRELDLRLREPASKLHRPIVTLFCLWAEISVVGLVIAAAYIGLKLVVLQSRLSGATTDWSAVARSAILAGSVAGVASAIYALVASKRSRNAGYNVATLVAAATLITWIYVVALTAGALGTTRR